MSLENARAYLATLSSSQRRRSVVTRWGTALDNYSPTREHANGHAVSFTRQDTGETGYVLFGIEKLPLASESIYIVDDGETVTAMYPVAWHGGAVEFGSRIVLHPIASSERYVMFGPKRAYSIKFLALPK